MKKSVLIILSVIFSIGAFNLQTNAQRSKIRVFNFNKPKAPKSQNSVQSSLFEISVNGTESKPTVIPPISSRKPKLNPKPDQSNPDGRFFEGGKINNFPNTNLKEVIHNL